MSLKLNQKFVLIAPFDLVIPALPMPVSVIVKSDCDNISVPIDNVTVTLALPEAPGFGTIVIVNALFLMSDINFFISALCLDEITLIFLPTPIATDCFVFTSVRAQLI